MILIEDLKPVRFWPYTSTVHNRVVSIEYHSGDAIDQLHHRLIKQFNENGIKARMDNKTVFEFLNVKAGIAIYIGFYDWTFSVGLDMSTDEGNKR